MNTEIENPSIDLPATVEELDAIASTLPKLEDHHLANAVRQIPAVAESNWKLLKEIFDFHFRPSDADEPFGPMMTTANGRTMIPSDLTPEQLDFLLLFMASVEPEIRARIGDILWLCKKDYPAAQLSVEAYIGSGSKLEDIDHWVPSIERYERAIRLAAKLGKKTHLLNKALAHIDERVRHYNGNDPLFFTSKALNLLHEFDYGNPLELAAIGTKVAEVATAEGNHHRARAYFEIAAKLNAKGGDKNGANSLLSNGAESFVIEAKVRESGNDFLAAQHFWQQAYQAYRKIPGQESKLAEIHEKLLSAGEKAIDNMQVIKGDEIDVTDEVAKAQKQVSGLRIGIALARLVTLFPLLDAKEIKEQTLESAKNFPMQTLFNQSIIGRDGRVIHQRPSLMSRDEDEREMALETLVFGNADMQRRFISRVYLAPALGRFLNEHCAFKEYLGNILLKSPFIPPRRHQFFQRGFNAFFDGDFILAVHLLMPQVENAFRHLLLKAGTIPHTVEASGIERKWTLKKVLNHPKLAELVGENMIFELRVLLENPAGANMRNNALHGLSEVEDLLSNDAQHLLWLFLRLSLGCVKKEEFDKPDYLQNRLKSKAYLMRHKVNQNCRRIWYKLFRWNKPIPKIDIATVIN